MESETYRFIASVAETKEKFPQSSWIRISTITMNAKYSREIDYNLFKDKFRPVDNWKLSEKNGKSFYNCVVVMTSDQYTNKNVKIFPNGSIHVTGCCDLMDTVRMAKKITKLINDIMGYDGEIPTESIVTRLINTNFSCNSVINLHRTYNKFKEAGFEVDFDSDRYSAVKVKFTPVEGDRKVTVSIFSTGKILVVTGGSIRVIADAYRIVNKKLVEYGSKVEPSEKQEQYPVFMGYPFSQWAGMVKKKGITAW